MKKILLLMMVLSTSLTLYAQKSKLIASCCDAKPAKSFGRCSGNAYCTACTNCRYCKHCNSGGSCGVCTTYSAPVRSKKKTTRKKSYSTSSYSAPSYKSPSEYSVDDYLTVTSDILNVREDSGTDYDIVETVKKGALLKFISSYGEWIEVRVIASGNTGYVYYKYVN